MECCYFKELLKQKEQGLIKEIILQPSMEIIPAYTKYGRKIRKAIYTPDFLVFYEDGSHKYIEVKGFSKPDADLRRKLWDSKYPDELVWITGIKCVKGVYTEWVNYDDLKKIRRERRKARQGGQSPK